jgi:hypothetical protein
VQYRPGGAGPATCAIQCDPRHAQHTALFAASGFISGCVMTATITGTATAQPEPFASRPAVDSPADAARYADLYEQLFHEYEDALSLCDIVALVNQCRRDLAGSPATAMPELLERLARCRLATLAEESVHP